MHCIKGKPVVGVEVLQRFLPLLHMQLVALTRVSPTEARVPLFHSNAVDSIHTRIVHHPKTTIGRRGGVTIFLPVISTPVGDITIVGFISFFFLIPEELLTATLGLLESLFNLTWYDNDYFCKQFSTEDCIKALIEALKEVTSHAEDVTDSHLNHRRLREACAHWVTVVHRMTYHELGMNALGKHADTVFDLVSGLWVEQSANGGHGALHVTLAVELLDALLPQLSSLRHCGIGRALALLLEWEGLADDLRKTMEDFCVGVARQWALRGVGVEGELRALEGRQLGVLEDLLEKRAMGTVKSGREGEDAKLSELRRIIREVKIDH